MNFQRPIPKRWVTNRWPTKTIPLHAKPINIRSHSFSSSNSGRRKGARESRNNDSPCNLTLLCGAENPRLWRSGVRLGGTRKHWGQLLSLFSQGRRLPFHRFSVFYNHIPLSVHPKLLDNYLKHLRIAFSPRREVRCIAPCARVSDHGQSPY